MQIPTFIVAIFALVITIPHLSAEVEYTFTSLEWDWNWESGPDNSTPREYHPEAGFPFKLEVFTQSNGLTKIATPIVTVPRFINADLNPAGLNIVYKDPFTNSGILRPYPGWEINRLGNCSSLQSPTGVVVGRNKNLYVVDTGRVDVLTSSPRNLCPAKLVVFSLTGQLVESYEFPDSVVSQTQNFLTDIVLDYVESDYMADPKFAYISDVSSGGRIVVYDFTYKTSWAVTETRTFYSRYTKNLVIHARDYTQLQSFSSIALTPDFNFVYYSVTGYQTLLQIPTWYLRSPDVASQWRAIDCKYSSGALLATSSGLYYGALELDAIMSWKKSQDIDDQRATEESVYIRTNSLLLKNWETLHWTSAIRLFDDRFSTKVYYLSNKAHLFLTGAMNFTAPHINFRIGYI